ncbi:MAG TPA: MarR family winged helix-turn-helix transcriptional regulator [Rhizobiaceae bacterium]|nr:MarR family winged helix-turn-helix transcriptional regulator [Rhizobiaceae bacterium]
MPSTIDPHSFGFLLADMARLNRAEFDRRIASSGLGITPAEARTLFHVAHAGGERQNVIAERMGVEAMTVSGLIDRLEARGLVAREPDPTDRRAKLVRTTGAADAVLSATRDLANGVRDEVMQGIEPAEWQQMLATMKHAHAKLLSLRLASCERESSAA